MATAVGPKGLRALHLVLAQAALAATVVAAGAWIDRGGRAAGPEAPVAAYAAALARGDLAAALEQLTPEQRGQAAPFVEWQLGNRYSILESAVRSQSLLERLVDGEDDEARVVVTLDIQNEDGTRWRSTEELAVNRIGGRWLLPRAPLEPTP